eukprot:tig00020675_g12642.t1
MAEAAVDLGSLFFCGDTCQTVASGLVFRFCDLQSMICQLFPTSPHQFHQLNLSLNYRSHSGTLRCAAVAVDMLQTLFPKEIDDNLPRDSGLRDGPPPLLLLGLDEGSLTAFLFADAEGRRSLGADQVVIIRESQKRERISQLDRLLGAPIVLTVEEAKGLEFEDVLLFNFFADSPASDESMWREATGTSSGEKEQRSTVKHRKPFDPLANRLVAAELKQLYTALTRAKASVWMFDDSCTRKPMFKLFADVGVVESVEEGAKRGVAWERGSGKTPEDWRRLGEQLLGQEMAARAYRNAGDACMAAFAEAEWECSKAELERDTGVRRQLYAAASNSFLQCLGMISMRHSNFEFGVTDREMSRIRKRAAFCFKRCAELESDGEARRKLFESAARAHAEDGNSEAAADCYLLAEPAPYAHAAANLGAVLDRDRAARKHSSNFDALKCECNAVRAELLQKAASAGFEKGAPYDDVVSWAQASLKLWRSVALAVDRRHFRRSREVYWVLVRALEESGKGDAAGSVLREALGAFPKDPQFRTKALDCDAAAAIQRAEEYLATSESCGQDAEREAKSALRLCEVLLKRAPADHALASTAAKKRDTAKVLLARARLCQGRVDKVLGTLADLPLVLEDAARVLEECIARLQPVSDPASLERRCAALAAAALDVHSARRLQPASSRIAAAALAFVAAAAEHLNAALLKLDAVVESSLRKDCARQIVELWHCAAREAEDPKTRERWAQSAINCLKRIGLPHTPQSAEIFLLLGEALEKQGRLEPAVEAVHMAVALDVGSDAAQAELRRMELALQDRQAAAHRASTLKPEKVDGTDGKANSLAIASSRHIKHAEPSSSFSTAISETLAGPSEVGFTDRKPKPVVAGDTDHDRDLFSCSSLQRFVDLGSKVARRLLDCRRRWDDGLHLWVTGRYGKAIPHLAFAVKRDQRVGVLSPGIHLELQCLPQIRAFVTRNPHNVDAIVVRIVFECGKEQNTKAAASQAMRALALAPDDWALHEFAGGLHTFADEYSEGARLHRRALELLKASAAPGELEQFQATVLANIGFAECGVVGREAEALAALQTFVGISSPEELHYAKAHFQIAWLHMKDPQRCPRLEEVVAWYDNGVKAERGVLPVYKNLRSGETATKRAVEKRFDELREEGVLAPRRSCAHCGVGGCSLSNCARCKEASYCSPECQRGHWEAHKQSCKEKERSSAKSRESKPKPKSKSKSK